jgi:hypothetical protein
MSHNKFMRRYTRHKTKHASYFEGLAAGAVRGGPIRVQFGEQQFIVEVRTKSPGRKVLVVSAADGRSFKIVDITDHKDQVSAVADNLMSLAANVPGVVIPPSDPGRPNL